QIGDAPSEMPFQPSFRHLTSILQIHDGSIEKAREAYKAEIKTARDERRFNERAACALFWLQEFAPEDFKFGLNKTAPKIELADKQKDFIGKLIGLLETKSFATDKVLHEAMYAEINALELAPTEAFPAVYQLLISKE